MRDHEEWFNDVLRVSAGLNEMAFFEVEEPVKVRGKLNCSVELLHREQCKLCSLNNQPGLRHPNMKPTGTTKPVVYFLGEAPGATEDARGEQFVGDAGQVLRMRIPSSWKDHIRWNNCVRTRPPGNRTPTDVEIECCRPSVIADIECTKPVAIFGFGAIPLQWALGQHTVTKWNGRHIPVQIGRHKCWYFPMLHPSYVLRTRRYTPRGKGFGSDIEFRFAKDLENAFNIVEQLPDPVIHTPQRAQKNVEWVDGSGRNDLRTVMDRLNYMAEQKLVGYDYETNTLRPYRDDAKLLTVALASDEVSFAFPLAHKKSGWDRQDRLSVMNALCDFLRYRKGTLAVHYLPFELEWTGVKLGKDLIRAQRWDDTVTQAYLLDERRVKGKPGCHSLEFLCLQYFGFNVKDVTGVDRKNLDEVDIESVLKYNAIDSKYHRLLYLKQRRRLTDENLQDLYEDHLRRVPTFVLTQMKGIPIEQSVVESFYGQYIKELDEITESIRQLKVVKKFRKIKGRDFQPSAPEDVKFVLKDILNLKVPNTDESVLSSLKNPIGISIIKYRNISKTLSTYVEPLRAKSPLVYSDGTLIHPTLSATSTDTSRSASGEPNQQNFPKRKNKELRRQIQAPSGHLICSFDYGQIQARNVGMESKDKALVKAFWDRYDIHADWTWRIIEKYPKWVDGGKKAFNDKVTFKKYRNMTKNQMVFPSFFGAFPSTLSRHLGIPLDVCEDLHHEFWDMFPDIRGWQQRKIDEYNTLGYVTNLTGFRRRAPISQNQLINAPIQADEAAIVLDAMSRLSLIDDDYLQANMEIHDDLTFVWPKKKIDELSEVVIRTMLDVPYKWARIVPIVIEMEVGPNWCDMTPAGEFSSDTWRGELPNWRKV